jgi:anti-anti-sigma factor
VEVERIMEAFVQTEVADAGAGGLQIVVSDDATTTTIALIGEWDLAQREATRGVVEGVLAHRPGQVALDLRRVSFIDSSGVHAVVQLADCAARLKIDLVIVPGPRAVHRVFEVCELIERLPFISDP